MSHGEYIHIRRNEFCSGLSFLIRNESKRKEEEIYVLHDHVEGADSVGGDEEEGVLVDFIEVADLAASDKLEVWAGGGDDGGHCDDMYVAVVVGSEEV